MGLHTDARRDLLGHVIGSQLLDVFIVGCLCRKGEE